MKKKKKKDRGVFRSSCVGGFTHQIKVDSFFIFALARQASQESDPRIDRVNLFLV